MLEKEKFMLEGQPHPDMEIKEFVEITEEQRQKAHNIIQHEFTSEDRIDNPIIDIYPASGKIVLSLHFNKGDVGSKSLESVYPLE